MSENHLISELDKRLDVFFKDFKVKTYDANRDSNKNDVRFDIIMDKIVFDMHNNIDDNKPEDLIMDQIVKDLHIQKETRNV